MKKTKLMRAALLLLVLTLITSCFVGGTFAKYTTSEKGSDTARVAKWGVEITANGATFAEAYDADTKKVVDAITNSVIAKSVVSAGTDKVVAPGTKGNMVGMTITGTPEVAVRVNYVADFKVENWTVDGKFYCPLHIKVGNTVIDGAGFDNKAAFEDAVNDEISTYSKSYAAGTDLNTAGVTAPSVSWEWPFEHTGASAGTGGNPQTNENDTKLGNAETAPTVTLTITTTVDQIN